MIGSLFSPVRHREALPLVRFAEDGVPACGRYRHFSVSSSLSGSRLLRPLLLQVRSLPRRSYRLAIIPISDILWNHERGGARGRRGRRRRRRRIPFLPLFPPPLLSHASLALSLRSLPSASSLRPGGEMRRTRPVGFRGLRRGRRPPLSPALGRFKSRRKAGPEGPREIGLRSSSCPSPPRWPPKKSAYRFPLLPSLSAAVVVAAAVVVVLALHGHPQKRANSPPETAAAAKRCRDTLKCFEP